MGKDRTSRSINWTIREHEAISLTSDRTVLSFTPTRMKNWICGTHLAPSRSIKSNKYDKTMSTSPQNLNRRFKEHPTHTVAFRNIEH